MFLVCDLPKDTSDVDAGLDNFFSALRALGHTRYFEKRWWALDSDVWRQTEKYRDAVRARLPDNDTGISGFVANALNGSEHDDQKPLCRHVSLGAVRDNDDSALA